MSPKPSPLFKPTFETNLPDLFLGAGGQATGSWHAAVRLCFAILPPHTMHAARLGAIWGDASRLSQPGIALLLRHRETVSRDSSSSSSRSGSDDSLNPKSI